jgi:hypothetical protein
MPAACLANLILPKSVALTNSCEELKLWSSSLCNFLHYLITLSDISDVEPLAWLVWWRSQSDGLLTTRTLSVYSLRHLHQGRNELLQFANRSSRPLKAELPLLWNFPIPPSKTFPIPLVFFMISGMVCSSHYFYLLRLCFCDSFPLSHSSRYGNVLSQTCSTLHRTRANMLTQ